MQLGAILPPSSVSVLRNGVDPDAAAPLLRLAGVTFPLATVDPVVQLAVEVGSGSGVVTPASVAAAPSIATASTAAAQAIAVTTPSADASPAVALPALPLLGLAASENFPAVTGVVSSMSPSTPASGSGSASRGMPVLPLTSTIPTLLLSSSLEPSASPCAVPAAAGGVRPLGSFHAALTTGCDDGAPLLAPRGHHDEDSDTEVHDEGDRAASAVTTLHQVCFV